MNKNLKIGIGCDHGGFALKNKIAEYLKKDYTDVVDYGTYSSKSVDYPVYANLVANAVASGEVDRGIIVCGSGVGVSICANKVKGIRAVVCSEPVSAKYSRLHNNANVLCFGERIVGSLMAEEICKVWLETEFEGGRHTKRVEMIED